MGKRRFELTFFMCGEGVDTAIIELDDAVIEAVDDAWRAMFYKLFTPEDIAAHVGFNLVVNHARLSMLDGWADQPDENAKIIGYGPDLDQWDVEAEEITLKGG